MTARNREIAIVFDGPPGPESGRFVEVEVDGASVGLGRWEQVADAIVPLWELRFTAEDVERVTGPGIAAVLEQQLRYAATLCPNASKYILGNLEAALKVHGRVPRPWLDHVYNGPAIRLTGHEWCALKSESISGAFHVLYRDERCAIIDNGERGSNEVWGNDGTGRWLVTMLDRLVKP